MKTNNNNKSVIVSYVHLVVLLLIVCQVSFAQQFTMEQTLSDEAQRTTIAFDGLAFLTGTLGADSFFPPGKVADFWGFQYLRDNDPSRMGHNTDFLTRASLNMLYVLTHEQRLELIALASSQVDSINEYGYDRFVLMKAFRRLLEGDIPEGTTGLDRDAVKAYSSELYKLDGRISYQRARVMGTMLRALDATQKVYIDSMVGKGMLEWPIVDEPVELQGLEHDIKVAVMTYAGDMFSWYAGSVEADVYFCPERQGTYFGSFYMKDAPAVGNPGYSIDTNLTAGYGKKFLEVLSPAESTLISNLVNIQRPYLYEIVDRREDVSVQLRKFLAGETADSLFVLGLMGRYGELDGEIVYNIATNFVTVNTMINSVQMDTLMAYRRAILTDTFLYPAKVYLYASEIDTPQIPNIDFLFTSKQSYAVKAGWCLVSLPCQGDEHAKAQLFPTAISSAYAYRGEYNAFDSLVAGVGYWLKFPGDQNVYLSGTTIFTDTVTLQPGWNLIGSLGVPLSVNDVYADSPSLIVSNFIGYDAGYSAVDSLHPCRAYWVKANITGSIILSIGGVAPNFTKVKMENNGETPPMPPGFLEDHSTNLPAEYALMQNYPNPFNPSTEIQYQLPEESMIKLEIYNVLGELVSVLRNGIESAGLHLIEWNAINQSSGIYFYKFDAVSTTRSKMKYSEIKKLVILK